MESSTFKYYLLKFIFFCKLKVLIFSTFWIMSATLQRSVIFATFFLSLFCGSLVCISLVTNHWIESKPWRKINPSESSGYIYFGLIYGRKELNFAIGLRLHSISGKKNYFVINNNDFIYLIFMYI